MGWTSSGEVAQIRRGEKLFSSQFHVISYRIFIHISIYVHVYICIYIICVLCIPLVFSFQHVHAGWPFLSHLDSFFSSFTDGSVLLRRLCCGFQLFWLSQEERYSRLPLLSGLRELIEQLNLAAGTAGRGRWARTSGLKRFLFCVFTRSHEGS